MYFDKICAAQKRCVATWQQREHHKKSWQPPQRGPPQASSGTAIPFRQHAGYAQVMQWGADNLPQQSSSSSNWQSSWSIFRVPPKSASSFVKQKYTIQESGGKLFAGWRGPFFVLWLMSWSPTIRAGVKTRYAHQTSTQKRTPFQRTCAQHFIRMLN